MCGSDYIRLKRIQREFNDDSEYPIRFQKHRKLEHNRNSGNTCHDINVMKMICRPFENPGPEIFEKPKMWQMPREQNAPSDYHDVALWMHRDKKQWENIWWLCFFLYILCDLSSFAALLTCFIVQLCCALHCMKNVNTCKMCNAMLSTLQVNA